MHSFVNTDNLSINSSLRSHFDPESSSPGTGARQRCLCNAEIARTPMSGHARRRIYRVRAGRRKVTFRRTQWNAGGVFMSDLGNLSQCMVDSDSAANGRARRLRGKALVASLSLEAVVIAGVLLWPLVTLGVLPPQLVLTPVRPYHGEQNPRPIAHHQIDRSASNRRNITDRPVFQPPLIPPHVVTTADPEPPGIERYGDLSSQTGSSTWIAGGGDGGPTIEVARPEPARKPRMVSLGVMDASLTSAR